MQLFKHPGFACERTPCAQAHWRKVVKVLVQLLLWKLRASSVARDEGTQSTSKSKWRASGWPLKIFWGPDCQLLTEITSIYFVADLVPKDKGNDKDKDTPKLSELPSTSHIFEILVTHSFQIWWHSCHPIHPDHSGHPVHFIESVLQGRVYYYFGIFNLMTRHLPCPNFRFSIK